MSVWRKLAGNVGILEKLYSLVKPQELLNILICLVMGNKSKEKKQMIGMKDHSYSVDEEKRCSIYIQRLE